MTQAEAEARALSRLAGDELSALPRGIGDVHAAIADRVFGALGSSAAPVRLVHDALSRGVYESVRGGLRLSARAAGTAVQRRTGAVPLSETRRGAIAIGALNGLYGDRLEAEGSPLAIPMQLRPGERLPPGGTAAHPSERAARLGGARHVAVFVHGLGETEYAWGSPSYGDRLYEDLGVTPVFVRYNSGRHISENGASLARLLGDLDAERITLIGHSMGGLVARAACHHGGVWTEKVRLTVSLGTPHAGAPLEQAVHAISAALHLVRETRPFARFLRRRSAGIRDLRRGSLVDEDWHGQDPEALRVKALREVPLLPNATHCFVAATITHSERHPLGRLLGDTLVLTPSASGRHIGLEQGITLGGTHHLALLNHPAVYEQLRRWLEPTACAPARPAR